MALTSDLIAQQREYERNFAACVFAGSHNVAINECSWLSPDSFLDERIGKFWANVITHGDPIRAANDGGLTMDLMQWVNNVQLVTRPGEYARKISEAMYFREIMGNLSGIAKAVGRGDAAAITTEIAKLQTVDQKGGSDAYTSTQVGQEFRELLLNDTFRKVHTYIVAIDQTLGGLFGSEMTMLAGRPGTGKTALALQIARNVAEQGALVLFLSLEMARRQLWARLACGVAGLSWRDVRSRRVSKQQLIDLDKASLAIEARLSDRLLIQDEVWTIGEIHQLSAKYRPDLVIVDQLSEIHWPDPREKEVTWYGKAARYLRSNIARRLDTPLLLLHQLSRGVEERNDKRPILSDLRWSGELEQASDVVLMTYREDYHSMGITPKRVPMELWARKNRQGVMNTMMMLDYDLEHQIITSAQTGAQSYAPLP